MSHVLTKLFKSVSPKCPHVTRETRDPHMTTLETTINNYIPTPPLAV